jgi:hypothetical protein
MKMLTASTLKGAIHAFAELAIWAMDIAVQVSISQ